MDNLEASRPASSSETDSSMAGQMELPLGEALGVTTSDVGSSVGRSGRQRRWTLENVGEPHQKGWGRHKTVVEYNDCLWCQPL